MKNRFFFAGIISVAFFAGTKVDAQDAPIAKPSDWVDIRQGTSTEGTEEKLKVSYGMTLPLVGTPWGFTDWSVQTSEEVNHRRFFDPESDQFAGIRATHEPCYAAGDHGQMLILPQVGPPVLEEKKRLTTYDRTSAVFHPAYLNLNLPQSRVRLEMAVSSRCATFRFTFDVKDKTGRILLNPAGPSTIDFTDSGFKTTSGYHRKTAPDNFKVYYVGELDRPITKSVGFSPRTKQGDSPTGYMEFDLSGNPVVELKIGSSMVGFDQAKQNLNAEVSGGIEAVKLATTTQWDAQLDRIQVDGTDEQKKTFYSCLFRALKFPHRLDEITAENKRVHYSPWDGNIHDGPAYTDNGLWDDYRTRLPLLTLVWPDQMSDICAGWLNAYREAGWLPNWPCPGGLNSMTGTHADIMFADAMVKGISGFDYEEAYAAVRKDAFVEGAGTSDFGRSAEVGRKKLKTYIEKGYLPQDKAFGVSDTLDYCFDDWAIAQAARLTGHMDDLQVLEKRAIGYRQLWDSEIGMLRPKDANGQWFDKEFDPFSWRGAYCEGGPWQYIFSAPFDVAGMQKLAGGNDAMAAKLDQLFSLPPTFHNCGAKEATGMVLCHMGQCALNNEPSFHIPYLYAAIGRPWRTEYWTRFACRTLFKPIPKGFPGDDDTGSTSSWYVLSSIGMYPLTPGTPQYILTSPLFKQVVIHLPKEKTFTITTQGNSDDAIYVQSRKLNGTTYSPVWISHQDIIKGGTMDMVIGREPVKQVFAGKDLPYSLSSEPEKHDK